MKVPKSKENNKSQMHNSERAAIPKATSPSTCVPKPRPQTPYDTPVQQVEFAKNMHAYLASVGPRVKDLTPGIQLYCDLTTQDSCTPTENWR